MKKIISRIKYWGQLLLLPIYGLSFLMPRDKNLWLFGSTFGNRFADNPRYLYLYASEHSVYASERIMAKIKAQANWKEDTNCKEIRPIWISHNKEIVSFLNEKGYESYYYHSLLGIWYALRGGIYFFDNYAKDINFWQSGGAMKINLWHGIPLKKIQHDNIFDTYRHPRNLWEKIKNFPRNLSDEKPGHYVLCPVETFQNIFASAFQTKNVIVSGYPRWDGVLNRDDCQVYLPEEEMAKKEIEGFKRQHSNGKVICYAPTFRDSESQLLKEIDINRLEQFLCEHDYFLYIKLHPKSKLKEVYSKLNRKNMKLFPAQCDSNVLIANADCLVTDYSSVFFDYMLTGRPVIFFAYDFEEYISNSREMYFEYKDIVPGTIVNTQDDLEQAILAMECGQKKEKSKSLDSFFTKQTEKSFSKKMMAQVKHILQG